MHQIQLSDEDFTDARELRQNRRIIELLGKYGVAKFGDEWWPGNAREWIGAEGAELEYLMDPGSAALHDAADEHYHVGQYEAREVGTEPADSHIPDVANV